MSSEGIIKMSLFIANQINQRRDKLIDILLSYESYETAIDEINRSVDCLENINIEINNLITGKVDSLCVFSPLNLPLYSFIIFAVVPSFIANRLYIRPPELVYKILADIDNELEITNKLQNISIVNMGRNDFICGYVSVSEAVIFIGSYENARYVCGKCTDSLFIYNGAGINPIIVTESADIDLAVEKTIDMRVFNSGQDCAGPDAILVDARILEKFTGRLKEECSNLKIGDYHDKKNRIGKLGNYKQIPIISSFFDKYHKQIIYGGDINFKNYIVNPTIIVNRLENCSGYQEFFAPVFNIIEYQDKFELKRYFSNKEYKDHCMYTSLFGDMELIDELASTLVLKNKIVNEVERGNYAYGGFGSKASFVSYNSTRFSKPILISEEISRFLINKQNGSSHI